jgi:predicted acylesterase/phospholipase RssA
MALVLGGGAPNFTLMTGALLAFDEAGVEFEVISGAGGGGGVALTYAAPKNMTRQDALKNTVNFGVSDPIYRFLPMNYKVFQKGSAIANLSRQILAKFPFYWKVVNQYGMTKRQKLISDLIQGWWAMWTPSTVNFFSNGLCANAPFIQEMVDFDKLKTVKEDVYLNAYNITDHKMAIFGKEEMDFRHFGATLSYPFVYPPTEIDGKLYVEGAAEDAFNFQGLLEHDKGIRTIVVFDAFGVEGYIQPPPNLWQAWGQSLILPLIALTRHDLFTFELLLDEWNAAHPKQPVELIKVQFDIPKDWLPTALDWSSSNLERMFQLGYETGKKFVAERGPHLGRTRD